MYSSVVHRGPDITSDMSVCEGSRVQRSSCFHPDFWGGRRNKKRSKVQNRVLQRKRDGTVAEFMPYGVDKITGDAVDMNMDKAENTFPIAAQTLESPGGPIHLLVGMNHMKDAPREQRGGETLCNTDPNLGPNLWCGETCVWEWMVRNSEKSLKQYSAVGACCSTLWNLSQQKPWEGSYPGDVLLARSARNVNFEWTACRSKRRMNMKYTKQAEAGQEQEEMGCSIPF